MRVTIEEAKQKWCPFINFQIGPHNAIWQNRAVNNRGEDFEPSKCRCIATDCMMFKDAGMDSRAIPSSYAHTEEVIFVEVFTCGISR